jgi:pimeloyl-ACP methyl ester carboxylesterase
MTIRHYAIAGLVRRRASGWPLLLLAVTCLVAVALAPSRGGAEVAGSAAHRHHPKPTVVLVHGAWADASNWSDTVAELQDEGYPVRAIANPLRTLSGDAASVRAFLETISGPIVLVGHSYGGAVITNAVQGNPHVRALVYVNAFAPDEGEFPIGLAGPDSVLSAPDPTTVFDFVPAAPPTGATELYLKGSVMPAFAAGLSRDDQRVVHASQRAATLGALSEPSGPPAWRTIPSWYLLGTKDKVIPPDVQRMMAQRANARIREYTAGHLGLITDPEAVVSIIERAARATG